MSEALKYIRKKLQGYDDYFAYSPSLNFDGQTSYGTVAGGIFSLFMKGMLLWFIISHSIQMVNFHLDSYSSSTKQLMQQQIKDLGTIEFKNENVAMLPFFTVMNEDALGLSEGAFTKELLSKLRIEWVQTTFRVNENLSKQPLRNTTVRFSRLCTKQDLIDSSLNGAFYASMEQRTEGEMLCPDQNILNAKLDKDPTLRHESKIIVGADISGGDAAAVQELLSRYALVYNLMHMEIDFQNHDVKPVRTTFTELNYIQFEPGEYSFMRTKLQYNEISTLDSRVIPQGLIAAHSQFWDVLSSTSTQLKSATINRQTANKLVFGVIDFQFGHVRWSHKRSVYTIWNLMSGYGGFLSGMTRLFSQFIRDVPGHLFMLSAISKMFIVKVDSEQASPDTQASGMALGGQQVNDNDADAEDEKLSKYRSKALASAAELKHDDASQRINNTRLITFNMWNTCTTYWLKKFTCCVRKGSDNERLMRIFSRGSARLSKQMDIRKMLIRLRSFKILQKQLCQRGDFHYHQFYDTSKIVLDDKTSDEDAEDNSQPTNKSSAGGKTLNRIIPTLESERNSIVASRNMTGLPSVVHEELELDQWQGSKQPNNKNRGPTLQNSDEFEEEIEQFANTQERKQNPPIKSQNK